MHNCVAGLVFLGLLTGCSGSEWDSAPTAGKVIASANANNSDSRKVNFASLPDRGELLVYAPGRDSRRRSYEVQLSEAHAINATHAGGKMIVPGPNGEAIVLSYQRHVEHTDGNWTWFGRDGRGTDAIITFGDKAAYGSLPLADGTKLRLTTLGGRAWLIRDGLYRVGAMGSRRSGGADDVLVPQGEASQAERSQSESPGAHSALTMVAGDGADATIDVLLGYTAGYARELGGSSEAITRLTYLVDVANQTYANSEVHAVLRLVGTLEVDYPDTADNVQTLKRLTADTAASADRALAPLRSAREAQTADLVALVRDFRAPQSGGCGIAWLIGGGRTAFDASRADFGYVVVNDGIDVDETDSLAYYCRDESLAHEFGHSMGQAHDREDSGQVGVHGYSYGYREPSLTGFHTVMAYALPGGEQNAIPYFANPHVSYGDRPTGVVNEADNARSMNHVLPFVAAFRTGDLDGPADPPVSGASAGDATPVPAAE